MNRICSSASALLLLAIAGCVYTPEPTARTGPGPDYARHVFSLYDEPAGAAGRAPPAVEVPLSVAVSELGQVAPPPGVLDRLRRDPRLVRRAEGVPGIADGDYETNPYGATGTGIPRDEPRTAMRRMLRLARDTGAGYLMLFGATVDSDAHPTGTAVADLTIVGAYLVPSRHLTGRARASAVLVDVRTSRVVLSAGTESNDVRFASAVGESGSRAHQVEKLRDDAFADLARQMLDDLARRAGMPVNATDATGAAGGERPVDSSRRSAAHAAELGTNTAAARDRAAIGPLPPDPLPARGATSQQNPSSQREVRP